MVEHDAAQVAAALRPGLVAGPGVEIEALMEQLGVPGVSVAVIAEGRVAWAHGWGRRSATSDDAVTAATRFQAGSISKSVAALCVMRLVARGELDLDEDVNARLRSWKLRAGTGWSPRVTVAQLLGHRGGTNVRWYPGYLRDAAAPRLIDVLDGTRGANTPPVRVITLPGLRHSYSGGGTLVLQQLLVDHCGAPFEELARDLVLAPLWMVDSGYEQISDYAGGDRADGHRVDGRPVRGGSFVYPEMAAAGLWSTAQDLARFLAALQAAARGAPGAVLPAELARTMISDRHGDGYGLGVRLWERPNGLAFGHGGDSQGFIAQALAMVEGDDGAVVMTNGDFGEHLIHALLDRIAAVHGWGGTLVGEPQALPGEYRLADGSVLAVRLVGGALELELPGQAPLSLRRTEDGTWSSDTIDLRLEFDEHGDTIEVWQRAESDLSRFRAHRVTGVDAAALNADTAKEPRR